MSYLSIVDIVIEELKSMPKDAKILVKDKLFTPEELIGEILNNTKYGRLYLHLVSVKLGMV